MEILWLICMAQPHGMDWNASHSDPKVHLLSHHVILSLVLTLLLYFPEGEKKHSYFCQL